MASLTARLGILGGGISGLSLAWRLKELEVPFWLIDAGQEPGGVLETTEIDEGKYQLSYGANTLFVDDEVFDFLMRAGLGPEWLPPRPVGKNRYILRGEEYRALPSGPLSLLFGDFFSFSAKRHIMAELRLRQVGPEDESVYDFFNRRFGREVTELVVEPFVGGIYAGDARRLLMRHTFPQVQAMEREPGSVLRGLQQQAGSKRRRSIAFTKGMHVMATFLTVMAEDIYLDQHADLVERLPNSHYRITTPRDVFECEQLIICLPAWEATRLLKTLQPDGAQAFSQIRYPEMAQIHLAWPKRNVNVTLKGFGGLHPPCQGRFTAGAIWVSSLFPLRCPHEEALLCVFAGGDGRPPIAGMTNEQILNRAEEEVRFLYRVDGPPTLRHMRRWPRAIPQYDAALTPLPQHAQALEQQGIFLHTNWYGGVSVYDCIKKALRLAEKLGATL